MKIYNTRLTCAICEQSTEIQRSQSKRKSKGHIKHLWCISCKDTTAHIEKGDDSDY